MSNNSKIGVLFTLGAFSWEWLVGDPHTETGAALAPSLDAGAQRSLGAVCIIVTSLPVYALL